MTTNDKAERSRMVGYALRAFVVAMIVIDLLAVGAAGVQIARAHATDDPAICDHRGFMHIERHGGQEADDHWHRSHGQSVTCVEDKRQPGEKDDDEPKEPRHLPGERDEDPREHRGHDDNHDTIPRRDHEGYHCTIRGCG
jgi:hypothetical protein